MVWSKYNLLREQFFLLQCLVEAGDDFTPEELEFKRGDVVTVTDRSHKDWCF